jgi:hypothetical protein
MMGVMNWYIRDCGRCLNITTIRPGELETRDVVVVDRENVIRGPIPKRQFVRTSVQHRRGGAKDF